MIEDKGTFFYKTISILSDLGSTLSYISPKLVETCKMKKHEFKNSCLVHIAIGTKRKVTRFSYESGLKYFPFGIIWLVNWYGLVRKTKSFIDFFSKYFYLH